MAVATGRARPKSLGMMCCARLCLWSALVADIKLKLKPKFLEFDENTGAVRTRAEPTPAAPDSIACPACKWKPSASDRWKCACGHSWNTFDTRGKCPSCGKQWPQTQCLRCRAWSPHAAWYADHRDPDRADEDVDADDVAADSDEDDEDDDEDEDDEELRTPVYALMQPLTPSAALAKVVGPAPLPRVEVIKRVWNYIKNHRLQAKNPRYIDADDVLREVFGGKDQVDMFNLTQLINRHLK